MFVYKKNNSAILIKIIIIIIPKSAKKILKNKQKIKILKKGGRFRVDLSGGGSQLRKRHVAFMRVVVILIIGERRGKERWGRHMGGVWFKKTMWSHVLSVGPLFLIFFSFLWTYPQVIPDNPFDRHSLPTAFGDSRQCFLLYFQTAFHSLHVPCCTFCLLLTPSPWHMQSTTRQIQSRAFVQRVNFTAQLIPKRKRKTPYAWGTPITPWGLNCFGWHWQNHWI